MIICVSFQISRSYPDLPYVGVYKIFNQPAILVRNLDLIKDIMSTNFNHFENNDFVLDQTMDPLLSNNPFQAQENKWKIHRSNMLPLFTPFKVIIFI